MKDATFKLTQPHLFAIQVAPILHVR